VVQLLAITERVINEVRAELKLGNQMLTILRI